MESRKAARSKAVACPPCLFLINNVSFYLWHIFSMVNKLLLVSVYSSTDKFLKRAVQFGFLGEATPVVCFLEASDKRFWKGFTSSNKSPLAVLLPPSKTLLLFIFNCIGGGEFLDTRMPTGIQKFIVYSVIQVG